MQKYEIMVILKSDLEEKDAEKYAQDGVVAKIKELGGTITFEDFWGSRGFAYRIKKYTWGYYFVAQFELDTQKALELRNEFNIDNKVLRHLITVVDPKAPAPRKYADMKKEYEAQEKSKKAEKESTEKTTPPAKREKLTTVKEDIKDEKAQEPQKETSKDEVDQAIDKVLDDATTDL